LQNYYPGSQIVQNSFSLSFTPYCGVVVSPSLTLDYERVILAGSSGGAVELSVARRSSPSGTLLPPRTIDCKFGSSAIRAISRSLAIGDNGKISTSQDSYSWFLRTSGTSQNLKCFGTKTSYPMGSAFASNILVVGGENGTLLYSLDNGLTWQSSPSAAAIFGANSINTITSTNDYFIAAGQNGVVAYSTDGITWFSTSNLANTVTLTLSNRFGSTYYTATPDEPFQFWAVTNINSGLYRKKAYPEGYNRIIISPTSPFVIGNLVNNGESGATAAAGQISCFDNPSTGIFIAPYSPNWAIGQFLRRGVSVYDANSTTSLTSLALGKPPLIDKIPYYVRSRYNSNSVPSVVSNWSAWSIFYPTASEIEIGSSLGGGYYAGQMLINSQVYNLIVAPKATGETSLQYRVNTNAESNPSISQLLNDGKTITDTYNDASHPAFQWAKSLNIGGFTDWYIPGRDELEVISRNLAVKQIGASNSRPIQDGPLNNITTDDFATSSGVNQNSVPLGYFYSTQAANTVTSAPLFNSKAGYLGSEALSFPSYWAATESSTNNSNAWTVTTGYGSGTNSGTQGTSAKNVVGWARAVRKVLATPPVLTVIDAIENFPAAPWQAEDFSPLTVTQRVMGVGGDIGNRFVAILEDSSVIKSSYVGGPYTWSLATPFVAGQTVKVAKCDGGFMSAITTGSSIKLLYVSIYFADVSNWSSITIPGSFTPLAMSFRYGSPRTWVIGGTGGVMKFVSSSTGVTNITSPFGTDSVLGIDHYELNYSVQWVAVGENGKVAKSSDGVNWTLSATGVTENLNAVSVQSNTIIAVGNNGKVIRSVNNGSQWSSSASAASIFGSEDILTISHGGYYGKYYTAIGASGTTATSLDGFTWVETYTLPSNVRWCTSEFPYSSANVTEGPQVWAGTDTAGELFSKVEIPDGFSALRVLGNGVSVGTTINNGLSEPNRASGVVRNSISQARTPAMAPFVPGPTVPPYYGQSALLIVDPEDTDWVVGQSIYGP
jgi:hypothetical protein